MAGPIFDDEPEIERVRAVAYQIIGSLADHAGVFDHPDVIRALDFFGHGEGDAENMLPWPREALWAAGGAVGEEFPREGD